MRRREHAALLVTMLIVVGMSTARSSTQQPGGGEHIVIPAMANATKPADLDFQAGECDVAAGGNTMACVFQQVFLTVSFFDLQTCLATTNRYELTFLKQIDGSWVSREAPAGECGTVAETVLRHEGGPRWTLESRTIVTRRDASPACRAAADSVETLSWRDLRRPLPCKFVQPGAMSR